MTHPRPDAFAAYVADELGAIPSRQLEAHVAHCATCMARLSEAARIELVMLESLRTPPPVPRRAQGQRGMVLAFAES